MNQTAVSSPASSPSEMLYQIIQLTNPLVRNLEKSVAKNLEEFQLTVTQRAMLEGLTLFGRVDGATMAKTFGVPEPCFQEAFPGLLEKELIRRSGDSPESFVIEAKGRELFRQIRDRENQALLPITEGYSSREIETMLQMMQQLEQAFTPQA